MDSYKNARDILPAELLRAVQEYLEGETVYVPVRGGRKPWGAKSGARAEITARNREIKEKYRRGVPLETLSEEYHLSLETIKKVVRGVRRRL